jgi:hypothetical protein
MIDWGAFLAEHGSTAWRTVYRLLDHHDDATRASRKHGRVHADATITADAL